MPPRGFHKIRCAQGHLFNEANVLLIRGDGWSCRKCRELYEAGRGQIADEKRRAKAAERADVLDRLTPIQLAYLAGLIDGEGCISASVRAPAGRSGPNVSLVLSIVMATPEPLITVAHWLEGLQRPTQERAAPKPHHRRRWNLRFHGRASAAILARVRPYLILKAEQADLAVRMDLARHEERARQGRRLSTDLLGELVSAAERMHVLNGRGVTEEVA